MNAPPLDKGYNPQDVDRKQYEYWLKENLFQVDEDGSDHHFSIVIPPPNVTGILHIGHALNITIQDIVCRYRRIKGDKVLWIPGTDHAGIATQNVVEKKLAMEGKSRHQLGRQMFIDEVWKWQKEYGNAIVDQLKRIGASCDWSRQRFTMDDGLSRAVRKVFVDLYNEGLIYRGNYITNWCCRCHTALSDLEVEHEEIEGNLYHIRYPLKDSDEHIVIATTRPETMLGDTAIAVNPDDERYQHLASKSVILPLVDRELPIIFDSYVDMSFGTGALKVTPAHDPNDFEIGKRHGLPSIKAMDDFGKMTQETGIFHDLDRFECRDKVIELLKEKGLLASIQPHHHSVGHCYRCRTIVEPALSLQWFVKTKTLAEKAIEAVKNEDVKIIPNAWTKTYFEWMNNIRDWCISRQLWWGHQIPVWTCDMCGKEMVTMDPPAACSFCHSDRLTQDPDVLDTWFSSALWPFSTLGWPEKTKLIENFYPTSLLVTAFDILFFWVARMMMMGLHFMKEVPFREVYIHALIRDENGQKMSKSKGNSIDPIQVIDKYGTDALRFTLSAFAVQGRDIKLSEQRVEGYRHFINKLWNAARFALMHINEEMESSDIGQLSIQDKWIISRLIQTTERVSGSLDEYKFNEASGFLYNFVWYELCDWYIESIKPSLFGKLGENSHKTSKALLYFILKDTLILLHPFIPFVTEEIWQKLPSVKGSIMKASFPDQDWYSGDKTTVRNAEESMTLLIDTITAIRNIRGEMNISPSVALSVIIQIDEPDKWDLIEKEKKLIADLARLNTIEVYRKKERPEKSAIALIGEVSIFVLLKDIVDFEEEKKRLGKEIEKLNNELTGINKKLNNADFLNKAPEDVVLKVKEKHATLSQKQKTLRETLKRIESL